ncbi:MAG: PaaI family thioesterase [candidate division NC10 bacterium]|nr:PaaI family thioesterase [candidate division NC10 bacterium]
MELVDDQMCFVCGKKNPAGLQLDFELVGDAEVQTSFLPTKQFQGFQDIVHGGIITTILDEVMVNGAWLRGVRAVTGKLEVRLKQAARVGERLYFAGRMLRDGHKTVEMESWAATAEGVIVAEARGLLVKVGR